MRFGLGTINPFASGDPPFTWACSRPGQLALCGALGLSMARSGGVQGWRPNHQTQSGRPATIKVPERRLVYRFNKT
jgi:hypothetical protein